MRSTDNILVLRPLTIIPDQKDHADAHRFYGSRYNVYIDNRRNDEKVTTSLRRRLELEYTGFIFVEQPFESYKYLSFGRSPLSEDEVEEAIKQIMQLRDEPGQTALG